MAWTMYYPVGKSDVSLFGEGRPADGEDYRGWTRDALEWLRAGELDLADRESVDFPLARPVVDYLRAESIRVGEVVLFATDQEDAQYRHTDTVYAAQILKTWLEAKLGEGVNVTVEHLPGNPSNYARMAEWMADYVAGLGRAALDADSLLVMGPGTPAMTTGLALAFSPLAGRVRALYVSRSEGVQPFELLAYLERERWRRALRELVEAGDFRGAWKVLRQANIEDQSLAPVFEALWQLVTFNAENAENALEKYEGDGFEDLGTFIRRVIGGHSGARLALLVANIKGRYTSGYRVEALALTSRFSESIMKLVVFNELGVGSTGRKRGFQVGEFVKAARKDSKFWGRFQHLANERQLNPEKPTWPVLKTALEVLAAQRHKDRVQVALEAANTFHESGDPNERSLSRLRNQTPYGHGFQGVGTKELREVLGGKRLQDLVDDFYKRLTGRPPEDVFETARRELIDRISGLE